MSKIIKFVKTYWITICIYIAMFFGYKYIADKLGISEEACKKRGQRLKEKVAVMITEGPERAMNQFNTRKKDLNEE